jgi:hypothetical protein
VLKRNELDLTNLEVGGGEPINALPLSGRVFATSATMSIYRLAHRVSKICDVGVWTGLQKPEAEVVDGECLEIPRCQFVQHTGIRPRSIYRILWSDALSPWHVIHHQFVSVNLPQLNQSSFSILNAIPGNPS